MRALIVAGLGGQLLLAAPPSQAASYVPIAGAGSTFASNAVEQTSADMRRFGLTINYQASGSSDGRKQFANHTVDFGVTEDPYDPRFETPPAFGFDYVPVTGGPIALMYNLRIGSRRVENLRLTPDLVARIFTHDLTSWDDPAIAARNPGLSLPATPIVPVVRADGTGTSTQFAGWLRSVAPQRWSDYCQRVGRAVDCSPGSFFPVEADAGFVLQSGALGTSGYVAQASAQGAITYVENAYPLNLDFPVARLLNASGSYVAPTATSAAIALLQARPEAGPEGPDFPASVFSGVWSAKDPRAYPLSSYTYMTVPTQVQGSFTAAKGTALTAFGQYQLCDAQTIAGDLGYAPLPVNVVQDGLTRLRKVPAQTLPDLRVSACANPTFTPDGKDTLAAAAPQPQPCARIVRLQCDSTDPGTLTPGPGAHYPAGASATRGTGTAIDVCAAPDPAVLDAWKASPYTGIVAHIGGANRQCAQPALTAAWATRAAGSGWRILPVYDGREAPCTTRSPAATINAATAAAQGQDAASDAIRKSATFGLRPGSAIFARISAYSTGDVSCRSAVLAFLSGFSVRLHAKGYLAGVRADAGSGIRDLASAFRTAGPARPDAIWITDAAPPTLTPVPLTGLPGVADEAWSNHQRAREDGVQHDESYGGATLTITRQRLDAPAATVAQNFTVTATAQARTGPDTATRVAATLGAGSPLAVLCQTRGRTTHGTSVWNKLAGGSYVNDAFVSTAPATGYDPRLPRCTYPAQVTVEDGVTASAAPAAAPGTRRGLFSGGLAWVTCQEQGPSAAGTKVWDGLDTTGFVGDGYLASSGRPGYSSSIPRCVHG